MNKSLFKYILIVLLTLTAVFFYYTFTPSTKIEKKIFKTEVTKKIKDSKKEAKELDYVPDEAEIEYEEKLEEVYNNELTKIQESIVDSKNVSSGVVVGGNERFIKKEELVSREVKTNSFKKNNEIFSLDKSEINNLNSNKRSGQIGGVHRDRFRQQIIEEIAPETIKEDDNEEVVPENLPFVGGQARGYTMLYLMHPRARDTVEAQVEALIVSGLKQVYLSVLIDGTFSQDFSYLLNVIERLNTGNRTLTLALYITNGSTMRRFSTTEIDAGFNKIDPVKFRDLIRFDTNTQEKFKSLVRTSKASFQLNKSLNANNKNIAIVMLEDNLKKESYVAMRDLAKNELGNLVTFIRNPCVGCYSGNDSQTDGDAIEFHNPFLIPNLSSVDGYTNDGTSYDFPNENNGNLTLDDMRNFIQTALTKKLKYFGLWRMQRQGLYGGGFEHPDRRNYEYPTVEQLVEEVKLLREGLK